MISSIVGRANNTHFYPVSHPWLLSVVILMFILDVCRCIKKRMIRIWEDMRKLSDHYSLLKIPSELFRKSTYTRMRELFSNAEISRPLPRTHVGCNKETPNPSASAETTCKFCWPNLGKLNILVSLPWQSARVWQRIRNLAVCHTTTNYPNNMAAFKTPYLFKEPIVFSAHVPLSSPLAWFRYNIGLQGYLFFCSRPYAVRSMGWWLVKMSWWGYLSKYFFFYLFWELGRPAKHKGYIRYNHSIFFFTFSAA